MSGSTDLEHLLSPADPALDPERYVFVCVDAAYGNHAGWQPIASFAEDEGLTLIVRRQIADVHALGALAERE